MSLSDFIEANLQQLIDDWAEYALQVSAEDSSLNEHQLRNSAAELLVRIAADMRETQSASEQKSKSRGEARDPQSGFNQTARQHADDRLAQGFSINDVVAEFRALRATVLRKWQQTLPGGAVAFQEMVRFNEAIDQALAESVRQYTQRTERVRDLFAGVLAHDLRSPLGAILNSSEVLLRDEGLSAFGLRAVANVQRSTGRMKGMIDDLLIFTRTRLGDVLPVDFTSQNLGRICIDAADEVRAAHPDAVINVRLAGELAGKWDGVRISQLVVNLLVNAVQHGSGQISVEAHSAGDQVTLVVSNAGNPIPASALPTLFDPFTRSNLSAAQRGTGAGMGLGLYICRCIARAHEGTIRVESSERGTSFTLQIPRFVSRAR